MQGRGTPREMRIVAHRLGKCGWSALSMLPLRGSPAPLMNDDEQESQALIPIEQQTITFRDHALVVVRLPDGRPGVVLRWICENLHIDPAAQVARIKRTEIIAEDLVYVRVETGRGFQTMPTLVLDSTRRS